ncbi:MAG: copper-binding protein [Pikeienuella sp.]
MIDRRSLLAGLAGCTVVGLAGSGIARTVHEVSIHKFKFKPDRLVVRPGDVIRWTNLDLAPHTATAIEGDWDTGALGKDEWIEIEVTSDFSPSYFCAFHPHMKGSVNVE